MKVKGMVRLADNPRTGHGNVRVRAGEVSTFTAYDGSFELTATYFGNRNVNIYFEKDGYKDTTIRLYVRLGADTIIDLGVIVLNPLRDVGVDAIISPEDTIGLGASIIPRVRIKNYTNSILSDFPVICSIVRQTGTRYTNTQNVKSLAGNDTVTVNFASWTPATPEICTVKIRTKLVNDANPSNDKKTRITQVIQAYSSEGFNGTTFPPSGWQRVIVQGTYNWERYTYGTNPSCSPYEGAGMAGFNSYMASRGSMARLITPAINIGATPTSVVVKFCMYRDSGYPEPDMGPDSIKVEYSQDEVNFTRVTAFRRYQPTTGWQEHSVNLGTFSGTLYVSFLAFSDYGNNIYIDYVRVLKSF